MGAMNSTPQTVEFVNKNVVREVEITENVLLRIQAAKRKADAEGKAAATTPTTTTTPVAATTTTTTTTPVVATTIAASAPVSEKATTTTTQPPPPFTMPTLALAAPPQPIPVQHESNMPPQQQGYNQKQQQQQQQPHQQPQQLQKSLMKSTRTLTKTEEIEESHYNNTVQKVESLLGTPVYWAQNYGKEIQLLQSQLKRCYQENPTQPLRCADMSKEYQDFVFAKQYHTIVHLGKKPPKNIPLDDD